MVSFVPPDKNDCLTRIVLDGTEYLFRFSYNYQGGFWTMGIYKSSEEPIIAGIKIVPGFPLNWYFRQYKELPSGLLGTDTVLGKIGRKDFIGGDADMVYLTESDMVDIAEEAANA